MNIEELVEYINRITPSRLVRFVSEQSENSCRDCLKHHNQIFEENDKDRPKLPIHPNCRCKYEYLTNGEVTGLQNELREIQIQLIDYGNQFANKINQLSAEYARAIKNHTNLYTIITVKSAFSVAWQTLKLIEKGKAVKEDLTAAADNSKLTSIVTALLLSYWAMKNIEQINKSLQEKMKQTGLDYALSEIISWQSPMQKVENLLKEWHYNRLLLPEQQLVNLPQSPEEAIKRGFIRAPDHQNLYHRNKGQIMNVKYYHPQTGQEVVFDYQGKVVTDPANIGTFNYGTNPVSVSHFWQDVLPYYLWGNSPFDQTHWEDRIFGPEKDIMRDTRGLSFFCTGNKKWFTS